MRELSPVTNVLCLDLGGVFTYSCKISSSYVLMCAFH